MVSVVATSVLYYVGVFHGWGVKEGGGWMVSICFLLFLMLSCVQFSACCRRVYVRCNENTSSVVPCIGRPPLVQVFISTAPAIGRVDCSRVSVPFSS
jgi:hypothetical protein